ncbi:hypothetical protein M2322_003176 [Rhodoblastus acidophilus]|uniref:hypothetical protein n=1 Tax=Rhodoblastus acidophilus TaxID=1074 RepID=UPI0022241177|nr:hypothetical protein [Rhodoblastus acidophilus]MCW2317612.1 hypothetical protein [Rhodoblastus acidophilus]
MQTNSPRCLFLATGSVGAVLAALSNAAAEQQQPSNPVGTDLPTRDNLGALVAELERVHARRIEILAMLADDHAINAVLDAEDDGLFARHWEIREAIQAVEAKNIADLKLKASAARLALAVDEDVCCSGPGSYLDLAAAVIDQVLAL